MNLAFYLISVCWFWKILTVSPISFFTSLSLCWGKSNSITKFFYTTDFIKFLACNYPRPSRERLLGRPYQQAVRSKNQRTTDIPEIGDGCRSADDKGIDSDFF